MRRLVRLFLPLLVLAMTGCAGSLEESRGTIKLGVSPEMRARCESLDDQHATFGGVAKGSAALSGASGLATLKAPDETWRIGLAVASAGMGAVAVGTGFVAEAKAQSWARECR